MTDAASDAAKGYEGEPISTQQFAELVDIMDDIYHGRISGRRLKSMSPTFQPNKGGIWKITFKEYGEGRDRTFTNRDTPTLFFERVKAWLLNEI